MKEDEKAPSVAGSPSQEEKPSCFGDPAIVCPSDEEGNMQPRKGCLPCHSLRSCLQAALRRKGVLSEPLTGKPIGSRITGFLKRWSDRKTRSEGS